MTSTEPPIDVEFSRFVDCGKLPSGGKTIKIEADAEERAALCERLSIDALIVLKGQLKAAFRQTCVISLQPVISDINITIERKYNVNAVAFWGHESEPDEEGHQTGGVQTKNLVEPPEPLENGGIDLGEVASEELAVEIDPFPRLAGAEMAASIDFGGGDQDEDVKNPFAVLEKLKKKLE
jgi:uncharacterized metal-binding protein YceD (DUF177 family)